MKPTFLRHVLALVALILTSHSVSAIDWIGANGNWGDAANWDGSNVPNDASESASITNGSAVTVGGDFTIDTLDLGASDTLTFNNGNELILNGDVTNNGLMLLDGTGVATGLRTDAELSLLGSGEVRIVGAATNTNTNVIGDNLPGGAQTLTNGASHTIRVLTLGNVGRGTTPVNNQGLLIADGVGANLVFNPVSGSNTGAIRAENSGVVTLDGMFDNTGGVIEGVTSGVVNLDGVTITGGEFSGSIETTAPSTATGFTNNGTIGINNGDGLAVDGVITNNSQIVIQGTGVGSPLSVVSSATLSGTGEVLISNAATGGNTNLNVIGGNFEFEMAALTNSASHTIRAIGPGNLGRGTTSVVNNGLVLADGADADLVVRPSDTNGGFTNNGTLRATAGGLLTLTNGFNNTNGVIEGVSGGVVLLDNATVTGGQLSGTMQSEGSKLINLTSSATIGVGSNEILRTEGVITNNGQIRLAPVGVSTTLSLDADTTFSGSGEVLVEEVPGPGVTSQIGAQFLASDITLTNASGHTIRAIGPGNLGRGSTGLVNAGVVEADGMNAELTVNTAATTGLPGGIPAGATYVNNGVFRAVNGGTLLIQSDGTSTGGLVEAVGTGSEVTRTTNSNQLVVVGNQRAADGGSILLFDSLGNDIDVGSNLFDVEFRGLSFSDMFASGQNGELPGAGASSPGDLRSNLMSLNSGSFRIGDGLDFTSNTLGSPENTGTIVAEAGSVFAMGGYGIDSGICSGNDCGGVIVEVVAVNPFTSTGTLAGSGTIANANGPGMGGFLPVDTALSDPIQDADIHSDGIISPGDNPGETGTLTLVGYEIELGDSNVIQLDIGPGGADELVLVTDSAPVALNGELEISLLPGYTPAQGDTFSLITAANGVSGLFDTETILPPPGALVWDIEVGAGSVDLIAKLPGDYNGNGVVDAADYTVWRDNLGQAAGTLSNDTDGGVIGTAQYNTWAANFGQSAGVPATAVPEPSSLVLMGILMMSAARRRA